jgi:tetratricopeptide (TPR) repeat protein/DNA-binding CsgD family transcriptional regulator
LKKNIFLLLLLLSTNQLRPEKYKADLLLDSCWQLNGLNQFQCFASHLSEINDRHQDTVLYFAQKAELFSSETSTDYARGLSQYFYANYYHSKGELAKSLKAALTAAKLLSIQNDSTNLARVYNELGVIYYHLGDYKESASSHEKSIQLISREQEPYLYFAYQVNMASVVSVFNNQESIRMLRTVLSKVDSANFDVLCLVHNALAIRLAYTEQHDSMLYHSNLAIKYLKSTGDLYGLGLRYASLASYYIRMKDWSKAEKFIDQAIALAQELEYYPSLASRYFTKTNLLTELGRLEEAEISLQKGKSILDQQGIKNYRESYLLEAARLNQAKGNYQKAYEYIVQWSERNDSIKESQNSQYIAALKTRYEVREKEQQIEFLSKQNEIQKLKSNQIKIVGAFVLVLLSLSLFILWKKRKKDLLIAQQRQQILKFELEEKKLKEKQLSKEVDFANQQLVTKTLKLTEKTKFLSQLQAELEHLQEALPNQEIKKTTRLSNLLHENSNIEKEWEEFRAFFERTNSDFIPMLFKLNPNLSTAEIRLALLINLRLDTKDCAEILHISAQSVKTARHRLKKKLKLPKEQALDSFLQQIE